MLYDNRVTLTIVQAREKKVVSRLQIKYHREKTISFCFETPKYSKIGDSLLINLTWNPRKKDWRGHPPTPRKLPPFGPPPLGSPQVIPGGGGGGGGGGRRGIDIF